MLNIIFFVATLGFGLLSSAGVFTVLISVGLIPRFAGKTHTASHILLYENMVILGTITGCLYSIFPLPFPDLPGLLRSILLTAYGLFTGIFVGCLAISIAELLNSSSIFARRVRFRNRMFLAIFSIGLGKLAGSLFYFYFPVSGK